MHVTFTTLVSDLVKDTTFCAVVSLRMDVYEVILYPASGAKKVPQGVYVTLSLDLEHHA